MATYHSDSGPVKSKFDAVDELVKQQQEFYQKRLLAIGVRLPSRDQCEAVLHWDEEVGSYCNGDVDVFDASRWPLWTTNFRYETNPEPDERELEMVLTGVEHERAILDLEFEESGMDTEEFHAWLDSLEPSIGELEARDLSDCGFGHYA